MTRGIPKNRQQSYVEKQRIPRSGQFALRIYSGIPICGHLLYASSNRSLKMGWLLCVQAVKCPQKELMCYNQINKQGGFQLSKNRREFTVEEQARLKENPYTYRVFKNSVRFTIEFKETFVRQYEAGIPPIKIVEGFGYDVDLLGKRCISSLYRNFKKQQASPQGLHEGSLRRKKLQPGSTDYESVSPGRAMKLMQHELLYLRQEVEFLKKIINVGKSAKQGEQ